MAGKYRTRTGRGRHVRWNGITLSGLATRQWQIDVPHSEIAFGVRHMVIAKVRGRFTRWQGRLWLDEQDLPGSRVEVEIEVASIDTSDAKRDEYLRTADFLDVARHPTITFRSRRVEAKGRRLRVTGDLTLRGVTRSLGLDAAIRADAESRGARRSVAFTGKATIDREAFGAGWSQALETGGLLVGKQVEVELTLRAIAPMTAAGTEHPQGSV
jgi:polyisoprenoid-binding protein YceI